VSGLAGKRLLTSDPEDEKLRRRTPESFLKPKKGCQGEEKIWAKTVERAECAAKWTTTFALNVMG